MNLDYTNPKIRFLVYPNLSLLIPLCHGAQLLPTLGGCHILLLPQKHTVTHTHTILLT